MPVPKNLRDRFTPKQVASITGVSLHMLNYLARMGYLQAAYAEPEVRIRGKIRYYSYRDLVVARTIQHLRDTGVELARLKAAIQTLARDETWLPGKVREGANPLRWLVTDGKDVLLEHDDGFIDQLRPNGQRAFGFVISLANIQKEVRQRIPRGKRAGYSMQNTPLDETPVATARRRRG